MISTSSTTLNLTLENVLRDAVDGVFVIDGNRRVVFFSDGCERITGVDRATAIGTPCPCHDLLECRDEYGRSLSRTLCPGTRVFNEEVPSYRQRMAIHHADGHRVWVETTYSPLKDDSGKIIAVVGIMRDASDAVAREQELREAPNGSAVLVGDSSAVGAGSEGGDDTMKGNDGKSDGARGPLDRMLTSLEKKEILAALERAQGQRTRAARLLGISRSRLYRRMEALGIDPRRVGRQ